MPVTTTSNFSNHLMLLFTGLQQAFNTGIYSPSIGFTLQFGNNAKKLVPLSGIFIGIGQILGKYTITLSVELHKAVKKINFLKIKKHRCSSYTLSLKIQ